MIASFDHHAMSPQAYLDWEAHQEIRHEYLDGYAYAMSGGTLTHNAIAINLIATLRGQLRGGPCRVFGSDAKVRISEQGPFFYPDVVVSCDGGDRQAVQFLQAPCLVVEVLSPTTEAYDRGAKFQQYRRLPSLREYLLISSQQISVDLFRLNAAQTWELHPYGIGDDIHLTSLDFTLPIDVLYEEVEFPTASSIKLSLD
ncbi:Uma2 family endonuclease [Spirulina sp. CCNP1310]|uniref:Uma2 family endonuclease n=1 Tax=Spirulina sp. CCNP1310 TaxID=3110249 RepID=UPI002B202594|nr:Uma2 family endonuclease [Spirulina sp. CCNP1310]MEA5420481.1 Uma2 family endonuclease [Spirulina sp. CCNP1310]